MDLNTETHRAVIVSIHPWTWFQKSAFSGSKNTGSVRTVGRNTLLLFHQTKRFCADGAIDCSKKMMMQVMFGQYNFYGFRLPVQCFPQTR